MQRETPDKTFRQIHRTKEAWFASIEDIIDRALVEVDYYRPIATKLLVPKSMEEFEAGKCLDFVLTPFEDIREMIYTAISYCWAQPDGLYCGNIPEYRIWESEDAKYSKPLRCPKSVFHRALQYAVRMQCHFFWIDQECINQEDPRDVEKHLKVMDQIYRSSTYPIAVLASDPLTEDEYAAVASKGSLSAAKHHFPEVQVLCDRIYKDRWFSRTWTFQERHSAISIRLLIPTKYPGKLIDAFEIHNFNLKFDLAIDFESLVSLSTNIHAETKTAVQGLSASVPSSELGFLLRRYIIHPTEANDCSFIKFYEDLERCDNLITADRIAIMGNCCWFTYRLMSNRIDSEDISYSTCIFSLLWANRFWDRENRQKLYDESSILGDWFEKDIRYCIQKWPEVEDIEIHLRNYLQQLAV